MNKNAAFPQRLATLLWLLAAVGLALLLGFWAMRSAAILGFPDQVEYGEGPVVDWAATIATGRLPYKPIETEPWSFSVYTPGMLLASAALMALGAPLWMSGRLVALGSTLLAVGLAVLLARQGHQRGRWAPLLAGALFLASPYAARWATFVRPDPLGLAFTLLGLWLVGRDLLAASPASRRLWLAALAFVAAWFTKQSFLAGPLAAVLVLWLAAPRRAAQLAGAGLLMGGLAGGALWLTTGGAAWENLVTANANPFSMDALWRFQRSFLGIAGVVLGLALVESGMVVRRWWEQRGAGVQAAAPMERGALLAALLLGVAFGLSWGVSLSVGKAGAWENYFLEPFALGCILAARLLWRWMATGGWAAVVAPLLVGVQLGLFLPGFERLGPQAERAWLRELAGERAALRAAVAAVAPGLPVLSEDLGVLPTTGRPTHLHTFVYTQLAHTGDWDEAPLLAQIEAGHFPLVIQRAGALADRLGLDRWTPGMLRAMERHYAISGRAGQWLLLRPAPLNRAGSEGPPAAGATLRGWAMRQGNRLAPEGPVTVSPGERWTVDLLWEVGGPLPGAPAGVSGFVHLLDPGGARLTQDDGPLRLGTYPPEVWQPGALVRDSRTITIPDTLPPGPLALPLRVGLYLADGSPVGEPVALAGVRRAPPALPRPDGPALATAGPLALVALAPLPAQAVPGATLTITPTWMATETPGAALTAFLHLTPEGVATPAAQLDSPPLGGAFPTTLWQPGEPLALPLALPLPPDLPPGRYTLRLGWYDPVTGGRAPAMTGSLAVVDDTILLGAVEVRAP